MYLEHFDCMIFEINFSDSGRFSDKLSMKMIKWKIALLSIYFDNICSEFTLSFFHFLYFIFRIEKMNVELIYFDLQGRATQIRVMLKMAGIEFTDTRLSKEEFGEKKPSFEESALGQLPVLKVNDKVTDSLKQNCKTIWYYHNNNDNII